MRFHILRSIYRKEMLDLIRDRRTVISMVAVPVLVIPLLMGVATKLMSEMERRSEQEARNMAIAIRVQTPAYAAALRSLGLKVAEKADLQAAVQNKEVSAAVEEGRTASGAPELRVYQDSSNPTSSVAAEKIRAVLGELKDAQVRETLKRSGVPDSILKPFEVTKVNVAAPRKMAGMVWGSMLGYLLLLMMFSGGMYPIIDMTAGEKERKTLEPFLATPLGRGEIVIGKTLAAITSIVITAVLTLGSLVVSLKGMGIRSRSDEISQAMSAIPLDARAIGLLTLTLIPMAVLAACVMMAIAMFARSFKEGQSYLTPLILFVLFPALMGGLPGLELTPVLCLIPLFNASQIIRGILLGEAAPLPFTITLVANLVYAGIAVVIARRRFEDESVLFRT